MEENWATLGPKLRGKIRLVVGEQDTFHLEEAAKLFCNFLSTKGMEDACEFVPERDHGNLYQDGLALRIDREMKQQYERARKR